MTSSTLPINKKYNYHSFIGGGCQNTISGNFSAILGGSGNTVNHAWASAFGCNVTSSIACAFHANQLVAPDTQPYFGSGTGLLQFVAVTPALVAAGLPAGSCIVLI